MMNGRFYMMYLAKVYFNLLGYLNINDDTSLHEEQHFA